MTIQHAKRIFILVILLSVSSLLKGAPSPTGSSQSLTKEDRLVWFKEAKFGLFIHWGPYAKLAGEWKGQKLELGQIAEWIMHTFQIPVNEYRDMARQFNPEKFNAQEWVALAKHAGMKYLVITAKHHDGFAMYHSKVSTYNIVDHTPFKRDPMKELAEECRKAGIKFCTYYSHREDWDHPYAYGNVWDFKTSQTNLDTCDDPEKFRQYLDEKSKPQLRELLTNYGPLGLIWFDRGMYTQQQGQEFASFVHELQPQCLVNGRVGHYFKELLGDYQNLNDNGMPIGGIEEYWETPQTLNETWGYSKHDTTWKRPEEIIRRLVEIVSKGGNYLLNVGPTGEGVIPQASVNILQKVGDWVSQNGESIYGTSASPFAETPWGGCTLKENKLYLHIFHWPADGKLVIRGLHNHINRAFPLIDKNQELGVEQQDGKTLIVLPSEPIDQTCSVIVLDIQGVSDVAPSVVEQLENGIPLNYVKAITKGNTVKRFNRKGTFHISKWTGPNDSISWNVDVAAPGTFDVEIAYSAKAEWRGRIYSVAMGEQRLQASVRATGDWYDYKTMTIGALDIQEPGSHQLVIRPESQANDYLMYFKGIRLIPR
ncbi:alpha-L-fucosidase [Planctomycetota bacterium]